MTIFAYSILDVPLKRRYVTMQQLPRQSFMEELQKEVQKTHKKKDMLDQ